MCNGCPCCHCGCEYCLAEFSDDIADDQFSDAELGMDPDAYRDRVSSNWREVTEEIREYLRRKRNG